MLQLQEVVVCILFADKVRQVCEFHLFYAPDGLCLHCVLTEPFFEGGERYGVTDPATVIWAS